MRLGQLARKYDLSVKDIITYLNDKYPNSGLYHHNSRLDEETELNVIAHFKVVVENESSEAVVENNIIQSEPETEEIKTDGNNDLEQNDKEEKSEVLTPDEETKPDSESIHNEELAIESNRLLELIDPETDIEDSSLDLDKITLIKAPKKELDGLTVVGKIELKEPAVKEKDSEEANNQDKSKEEISQSDRRGHSKNRRIISEEEREKRRLRAKRKKEEYEARKEKRRKEKEEKRKKEIRTEYYKQKVSKSKSKVKTSSAKSKQKDQIQLDQTEVEPLKEPKTLWGKFVRWLNT